MEQLLEEASELQTMLCSLHGTRKADLDPVVFPLILL